ncbi:unnamed protein product [Amoebophrya sp. A25]|nr:unnamed protein product [Amoebophrya sp. A25]|eukprot:GSA25T00017903001.1
MSIFPRPASGGGDHPDSRYRRIRVVGEGSFGKCYLVADRNSGTDFNSNGIVERQKHFIQKVVDLARMSEREKEDTHREVQLLHKLKHPYIIRYRESYVAMNRLCLVMDFAEGGDLYSRIRRQKKEVRAPFPENLVLRWFTQISLAVKYIHDQRILHRDLKTQNVFLTARDTIKIGDFGIARVLSHTADVAKTAIGTPFYMSPEICQARPYDYKSDVWALGCCLYEMLALRHAFDDESMRGLVMKILRGEYTRITSSRGSSNLRKELVEVVEDALNLDPKRRPHVRELLNKPILRHEIFRLLQEDAARAAERSSGVAVSAGRDCAAVAESSAEPTKPSVVSQSATSTHKDASDGAAASGADRGQGRMPNKELHLKKNGNVEATDHTSHNVKKSVFHLPTKAERPSSSQQRRLSSGVVDDPSQQGQGSQQRKRSSADFHLPAPSVSASPQKPPLNAPRSSRPVSRVRVAVSSRIDAVALRMRREIREKESRTTLKNQQVLELPGEEERNILAAPDKNNYVKLPPTATATPRPAAPISAVRASTPPASARKSAISRSPMLVPSRGSSKRESDSTVSRKSSTYYHRHSSAPAGGKVVAADDHTTRNKEHNYSSASSRKQVMPDASSSSARRQITPRSSSSAKKKPESTRLPKTSREIVEDQHRRDILDGGKKVLSALEAARAEYLRRKEALDALQERMRTKPSNSSSENENKKVTHRDETSKHVPSSGASSSPPLKHQDLNAYLRGGIDAVRERWRQKAEADAKVNPEAAIYAGHGHDQDQQYKQARAPVAGDDDTTLEILPPKNGSSCSNCTTTVVESTGKSKVASSEQQPTIVRRVRARMLHYRSPGSTGRFQLSNKDESSCTTAAEETMKFQPMQRTTEKGVEQSATTTGGTSSKNTSKEAPARPYDEAEDVYFTGIEVLDKSRVGVPDDNNLENINPDHEYFTAFEIPGGKAAATLLDADTDERIQGYGVGAKNNNNKADDHDKRNLHQDVQMNNNNDSSLIVLVAEPAQKTDGSLGLSKTLDIDIPPAKGGAENEAPVKKQQYDFLFYPESEPRKGASTTAENKSKRNTKTTEVEQVWELKMQHQDEKHHQRTVEKHKQEQNFSDRPLTSHLQQHEQQAAQLLKDLDQKPLPRETYPSTKSTRSPPTSHVPVKFLHENKTLLLPNFAKGDSIAYRLECVKAYLEDQLGLTRLLFIYRALDRDEEDDSTIKLGGRTGHYFSLIQQLRGCEQNFWMNQEVGMNGRDILL